MYVTLAPTSITRNAILYLIFIMMMYSRPRPTCKQQRCSIIIAQWIKTFISQITYFLCVLFITTWWLAIVQYAMFKLKKVAARVT